LTVPSTPKPKRPGIFAILPESIGIIGLGAIGGSLAWRATQAGVKRVTGYSRSTGDVIEALKRGAITDAADSPQAAGRGAALVVLAVPPAATIDLLGKAGSWLAPGAILSDVASIKVPIMERARAVGLDACFAGAHPLAGTHGSGFGAARPDLFRGAVVYVCPTGTLEGDTVARSVASFWKQVGEAQPVTIEARRTIRSSHGRATLPQAGARRRSRERWAPARLAACRSDPAAATRPASRPATPTCGPKSSSPTPGRSPTRWPGRGCAAAASDADRGAATPPGAGLPRARRGIPAGNRPMKVAWQRARPGRQEHHAPRAPLRGTRPGTEFHRWRAHLARCALERTGAAAARLGHLAASPGQRHCDHRARTPSPSGRVLNCGNSGTTTRLLLGMLAGSRFAATLTGDSSLRRRPMRRVTVPLTQMGARVTAMGGDGLPLTIRGGALRPLRYEQPVSSAQIKSCLLLAGVTGHVDVAVREPSGRSRDHTERLLRAFGFRVVDAADGWLEMSPTGRVEPFELQVPGDPSSAAFLVGAALLAEAGEIRIASVGINPTRTGFLAVLERMGGSPRVEAPVTEFGEPVGDLVVAPASLRATDVAGEEIPGLIDEIPLLAVVASRAEGTTVFRDVGELRVKESDRLGLMAENLRAVGAAPRCRVTTCTSPDQGGRRREGCARQAIIALRWPSRCSERCPVRAS
jgi:3-phosphoshikimate 1-carboxyvinyltransferase